MVYSVDSKSTSIIEYRFKSCQGHKPSDKEGGRRRKNEKENRESLLKKKRRTLSEIRLFLWWSIKGNNIPSGMPYP
jgi:hypothetical protein